MINREAASLVTTNILSRLKTKKMSKTILGAIAGDIIGSVYEWSNIKTTEFNPFDPKASFTDDTVLTVAVADALMNDKDLTKTVREYGNNYPRRGYGGNFRRWLRSSIPNHTTAGETARRCGSVPSGLCTAI